MDCKEVTFSQTEKEPRVNLYAAVAILAGRIASYIVLVGIVSHPIEVFLGILECKLSEDTEAVVLEEKLWFDHQIQSPLNMKATEAGITERRMVVSFGFMRNVIRALPPISRPKSGV